MQPESMKGLAGNWLVFVQFSEISDITAKDIFHMAINAEQMLRR
jgi:hypothetical protein